MVSVSTPMLAPLELAPTNVIRWTTSSAAPPVMLVPGSVAVIAVVPVAALVARPSLPAALLIVATPVAEELQVTAVVRSWVELSV